MWRFLGLAMLAGCRVAFDQWRPDAESTVTDAATTDAATVTDAPPDAYELLAWGTPEIVPFANNTGIDDPSMTADGLELYVNPNPVIEYVSRATVTSAWSARMAAPGLPAAGLYSPHLSADGLTLWMQYQPGGPINIAVSTRATRSSAWSTPQFIPELASASRDDGPCVTSDALAMVFDSDRSGATDLYITTRTSATAAWTSPVAIAEVNSSTDNDSRPHLSDDRLRLYFNRNGDLWVAARTSALASFDPPVPLTTLNTAMNEQDPWESADGKLLLWAVGSTIYQARR